MRSRSGGRIASGEGCTRVPIAECRGFALLSSPLVFHTLPLTGA